MPPQLFVSHFFNDAPYARGLPPSSGGRDTPDDTSLIEGGQGGWGSLLTRKGECGPFVNGPYDGDEALRPCPWGAEIRPCAGGEILRYGQDDRGSGNGKDDYSGKRFE